MEAAEELDENDNEAPPQEVPFQQAPQMQAPLLFMCPCGCELPPMRTGTVAYFRAHLDKPLWAIYDDIIPGKVIRKCKYTLRQTVNSIIGHIKQHGPGREELESVLRMYAAVLPEPHNLPTSFYMIVRLAGASHWSDFIYHVCSSEKCTGHVYGKPSGMPEEADTYCPLCQAPRYTITSTAGELFLLIGYVHVHL